VQPSERSLDDVSAFIVSVAAGEYLFKEHDLTTELFVVKEGQIELLKARWGDDRRMELLEPGDFFGESSLLEGAAREMSARAVTAAQVLKIDGATFGRLVAESPDIAVQMLRNRSRRVREQLEAEQRSLTAARAVAAAAKAHAPVATAPQPVPAGRPVLVHSATGTRFVLAEKSEHLVGRPERASGIVPDIDLSTLDTDRTLSRRHARIVQREGRVFVREEAATTNGTFLNASRLETGVEAPVADGDRVRFGRVELVLRWE